MPKLTVMREITLERRYFGNTKQGNDEFNYILDQCGIADHKHNDIDLVTLVVDSIDYEEDED